MSNQEEERMQPTESKRRGLSNPAKGESPDVMQDLRSLLQAHHSEAIRRLDGWIAQEQQLLLMWMNGVGSTTSSTQSTANYEIPKSAVTRAPSHASFASFDEGATTYKQKSVRTEQSEKTRGLILHRGNTAGTLDGKPSRRKRRVPTGEESEFEEGTPIWRREPEHRDTNYMHHKILTAPPRKRTYSAMEILGLSMRKRVEAIVASRFFEVVTAVMIFVNTAFMGLEVELEARNGIDDSPNAIRIVNFIFTCLFSGELILRGIALGRKVLHEEHRTWFFFDGFLVVTGLFDLFAGLAADMSGTELGTARMLRIIRITRMIRVLRFVRLVQFIRALRVLIYSIVSTLKSVAWAVILLFIVIYCFALLFTQAVSEASETADEQASHYWGDLGTSTLTLLESITGGLDWYEPMEALQRIHPFWMLVFLGFILFTYFAIMNVMTAAFCQGAADGKHYDRDQTVRDLVSNKRSGLHKTTDLFQNMFQKIDADGSGDISWDEFYSNISDDSVQALLALLELEDSDLWVLFQILDADGSERLDVREFLDGCMRLRGNARSIDLAKLSWEHQRLADRMTVFMRAMRAENQAMKASMTTLIGTLSALATHSTGTASASLVPEMDRERYVHDALV